MPSIIVPARNNAEFTATCLASILFAVSRLNLNCEFILVDDASEPEEKVLDAFRQHRAKTARETHCNLDQPSAAKTEVAGRHRCSCSGRSAEE